MLAEQEIQDDVGNMMEVVMSIFAKIIHTILSLLYHILSSFPLLILFIPHHLSKFINIVVTNLENRYLLKTKLYNHNGEQQMTVLNNTQEEGYQMLRSGDYESIRELAASSSNSTSDNDGLSWFSLTDERYAECVWTGVPAAFVAAENLMKPCYRAP